MENKRTAVHRLLTPMERPVYEVILRWAEKHKFVVQIKLQLALIVPVEQTGASRRMYEYVTNNQTHVDFTLSTRLDAMPVLCIEYDEDSRHRTNKDTMERDALKDVHLAKARMPLFRIRETDITRTNVDGVTRLERKLNNWKLDWEKLQQERKEQKELERKRWQEELEENEAAED